MQDPKTERGTPSSGALGRNIIETHPCRGQTVGKRAPSSVSLEAYEAGNLPGCAEGSVCPQREDILATKRVRIGLKNLLVLPSLTLHFVERSPELSIV